jgi:hypothetical protein
VPADEPAAVFDAMRVVRDKHTGQLRAPSSEQLKEMLDAEKADRKARGEANALPQRVA